MKQWGFGSTMAGEAVTCYELTNRSGMRIRLLDYGAILVSVELPDGNGSMTDVVLGYDAMAGYEDNPPHFGAVIGRGANRIDKGCFTLNGISYQLAQNNNENNLHSGPELYEHRMWKGEPQGEQTVVFTLESPHMDQGYPGNAVITVSYTLTESNEVRLDYEIKADQDTVANPTNHSYFNLSGHQAGTILDHQVWIQADAYTPVRDHKAIPDGSICPVAGTPMDFTEPAVIGEQMDMSFEQLAHTGGYDHNYVLAAYDGTLQLAARVESPVTGIAMEVYTDLPGMQFYIGNFIKGPVGKDGVSYRPRQGFCMETQYFPNSVNETAFMQPFLKKGDCFRSTTSYKFIF